VHSTTAVTTIKQISYSGKADAGHITSGILNARFLEGYSHNHIPGECDLHQRCDKPQTHFLLWVLSNCWSIWEQGWLGHCIVINRRSQWPRRLRRRSAVARLMRLWIRIPPGAWMPVVSVVYFQAEVSTMSWSLVQRSPTECVASLCVI